MNTKEIEEKRQFVHNKIIIGIDPAKQKHQAMVINELGIKNVKATARKIAVLYYNVMTKGKEFVEKGIMAYQQKVWQSHHYVKRTKNKIYF